MILVQPGLCTKNMLCHEAAIPELVTKLVPTAFNTHLCFNLFFNLLQEAVTAKKPPEGFPERVLVFAETVAAANGAANALEAVGVAVLRYHKAIPASDRTAALTAMSK